MRNPLLVKSKGKWRENTWARYGVDGLTPQLVADFTRGRYRAGGGSTTFSDLFTTTRAGNATMVDSDGVLKWAPHNIFSHSENFNVGSTNWAALAWTAQGTPDEHQNAAEEARVLYGVALIDPDTIRSPSRVWL